MVGHQNLDWSNEVSSDNLTTTFIFLQFYKAKNIHVGSETND